jgi:hypothetical protein
MEPETHSRWDWLWTSLRVLTWVIIGVVALLILSGGVCFVLGNAGVFG